MTPAHHPILDRDIQAEIFRSLQICQPQDVALDSWSNEVWFADVERWILASSRHSVRGLDTFVKRAYCAGVSDAIQSFVLRYGRDRRMRFSRAEFVAGKIACNSMAANWEWLEQDDLRPGDALIFSQPFSGNGNVMPNQDHVLAQCQALDIPVLIDIAYFPISHGLTYDFSLSCVRDVAISFSKPFSTMLRLGMRWSKDPVDDIMQANGDIKVYNRLAVWVAQRLLRDFSHDWLINRYHKAQVEICQEHGLEPTSTVTLALGSPGRHDEFARNGYIRICITNELGQHV